MSCQEVYATAEDYASWWCVEIGCAEDEAVINNFLRIAASDINAALAASGQCDCTLASWALEYLKKIDVIDAAIYHRCSCARPQLTDEMRQAFLTWMNEQLALIRQGKLELCAGATGAEYPAIGWAEYSFTDYNAAQIIVNTQLRTP